MVCIRNLRIIFELKIILVLLHISTLMFSCQCTHKSKLFVDNLEMYDFVGIIEVLKEGDCSSPPGGYNCTTVKVIESFVNQLNLDTFRIIRAKGFECIVGLHHEGQGDRFIVKGFKDYVGNYEYDFEKLLSGQIEIESNSDVVLSLSLCDTNQLYIEPDSEMVYGGLYYNFYSYYWKLDNWLKSLLGDQRVLRWQSKGYLKYPPHKTHLSRAKSIIWKNL